MPTPTPYIVGRFEHVLDPPGMATDPQGRQWYVNDHCLVAAAGAMHWFGITNPYPPEGGPLYGPGSHRHIGHASAAAPFGPWTAHQHAFALPEDTEECIGACFVVPRDDDFLMVYGYNRGFHFAVSDDLMGWRALDWPKFNIGPGTRDPCVVRDDDGTWLLYCACGQDGFGSVGLATSTDLERWTVQPPAMVSDAPGDYGPLESPFVLRHAGRWYLFVNHSHHQYEETLVFVSDDPRRFDWEAPLTTLFAHATEIVAFGGRLYLSHCGIEDRHWSDTRAPYGLYLAELGWR